jgi:hypothetical protein
MGGVFSQTRASLLVKGLKNPAQLGLPKQGPAPASVFSVFSVVNPAFSFSARGEDILSFLRMLE